MQYKYCNELIDNKGADAARGLRREGEGIYARKPNKITNNVTWSQEEYAHLGFQHQYLALKSVQRFTETWALLERAHRAGLFEKILGSSDVSEEKSITARIGKCKGKRILVASLGGGPGFELLALEKFLNINYGEICT